MEHPVLNLKMHCNLGKQPTTKGRCTSASVGIIPLAEWKMQVQLLTLSYWLKGFTKHIKDIDYAFLAISLKWFVDVEELVNPLK